MSIILERTMRKSIKNYTTEIPVEKTLMEVQSLLASKGAQKIMIEYESGAPSGLTFLLETPKVQIPIRLPARVANVEKFMHNKRRTIVHKISIKRAIAEQAQRTAWRNIKDWIDAQIALIETEMVTMQEVFFPYIVMGENTIFERFESGSLQLEQGRE